MTTTPETFRAQLAAFTAALAGRPLDAHLDAWLNREHGAGSATYAGLKAACEDGVAADEVVEGFDHRVNSIAPCGSR